MSGSAVRVQDGTMERPVNQRGALQEGPTLLEVTGLTKQFGGLKAVNDLSFQVALGEVLAIVGPNGAGKSTLFQLISGVERPDSGSIMLNGVELAGRPPEFIAALGVSRTFQTPRVFPGLTVWDSVGVGVHKDVIGAGRPGSYIGLLREMYWNVVRPAAFRRRVEQGDGAAAEAVRRFGERLWPRRFHRADSLSYANRRRLEIARALSQRPVMLLLDEPTAGMNPTETAEFAGVLQDLHREWPDMTILLVEHKLQFVRTVADRVLVMNEGRKLVEGDPDAVMQDARVVEAYLGK